MTSGVSKYAAVALMLSIDTIANMGSAAVTCHSHTNQSVLPLMQAQVLWETHLDSAKCSVRNLIASVRHVACDCIKLL